VTSNSGVSNSYLYRMDLIRFQPVPALAPFVKGYIVIESQTELVNRVLPDTSIAIAFQFRGRVNYLVDQNTSSIPVVSISGLRKSNRLINYTPNTSALIVQFKPGGAAPFFTSPMNELFGETTSLENVIGIQRAVTIQEQLAESVDNRKRISIVENFLLSSLKVNKTDMLIATAVNKINFANGNVKIKSLASDLCISHDAFEKRFRKIIGATPKQFASIVRMNAIIQQHLANRRLKSIAFDAGYFDQPHFNKEFKLFTGQTPTDFLRSYVGW